MARAGMARRVVTPAGVGCGSPGPLPSRRLCRLVSSRPSVVTVFDGLTRLLSLRMYSPLYTTPDPTRRACACAYTDPPPLQSTRTTALRKRRIARCGSRRRLHCQSHRPCQWTVRRRRTHRIAIVRSSVFLFGCRAHGRAPPDTPLAAGAPLAAYAHLCVPHTRSLQFGAPLPDLVTGRKARS
jgi:hypothetical protein